MALARAGLVIYSSALRQVFQSLSKPNNWRHFDGEQRTAQAEGKDEQAQADA
jgi:hypothetical protein